MGETPTKFEGSRLPSCTRSHIGPLSAWMSLALGIRHYWAIAALWHRGSSWHSSVPSPAFPFKHSPLRCRVLTGFLNRILHTVYEAINNSSSNHTVCGWEGGNKLKRLKGGILKHITGREGENNINAFHSHESRPGYNSRVHFPPTPHAQLIRRPINCKKIILMVKPLLSCCFKKSTWSKEGV